MKKYFGVKIEFNKDEVIKKITNFIATQKIGYVCVVDGNVLTVSYKNKLYSDIINNSVVNICDGSSISMLASIIHNSQFQPFTGPDIFSRFITQKYRQYFLGNTEEVMQKMRVQFELCGIDNSKNKFCALPFRNVEDFDYEQISREIIEFQPDIIWVSLGAPKQEVFISKLIPYLESGLLFGIGAAFNFILGEGKNKRAPRFIRKLKLEWLFRSIKDPKRIGTRAINYLRVLPGLIKIEIKNKKNETVG
jgi:N-acetylglucosaminyldiphosphoundecaprenol N-acetyl-beta-D-mannosaminyltransferase